MKETAFIVKDNKGEWVIKAPLPSIATATKGYILPVGCFSTDNRGFDTDPTASARVTFETEITLTARNMSVNKVANRETVRVGVTRNVDCKTGADLQPPRKAEPSTVAIGDVKSSQRGRMMVFNVRASTSDPFYSKFGLSLAPRLDFELVITYDIVNRKVTINGVTGTYPSFEAYYTIEGGNIHKILNRSPPEGANPSTLYDLGTGINTINFDETIPVSF